MLGTVGVMAVSTLLLQSASYQWRGLSTEEKQHVLEIVNERYELPATAELNLREREGMPGFFKRITVVSTTPAHPFEKDLLVTGDGRFVVELVGDLAGKPVEAKRSRLSEIAARLEQDDPPRLGAAAPTVTVVMYVDFQCAYCREAEEIIRERLNGTHDRKLQLLFKHHPLPSHEWSRAAARNGACIYKQGNDLFWKYSDFVFQHQAEIDGSNVTSKIAEFVGGVPELDVKAFKECMESNEPDTIVLQDENSGSLMGVNATPTLFVNGEKILGINDKGEFLRLLDQRESVAGGHCSGTVARGPGDLRGKVLVQGQ